MLQIPAWRAGNELPQGDRAHLCSPSKSRDNLYKDGAQRPLIQRVDFSLSHSTCPGCRLPEIWVLTVCLFGLKLNFPKNVSYKCSTCRRCHIWVDYFLSLINTCRIHFVQIKKEVLQRIISVIDNSCVCDTLLHGMRSTCLFASPVTFNHF